MRGWRPGVPLLFPRLGRRPARHRDAPHPRVTFRDGEGAEREFACDFVAGCDGFHGVSRARRFPASAAQRVRASYPFGWLGVLAAVAPRPDGLIYACTNGASRGSASISRGHPVLSAVRP